MQDFSKPLLCPWEITTLRERQVLDSGFFQTWPQNFLTLHMILAKRPRSDDRRTYWEAAWDSVESSVGNSRLWIWGKIEIFWRNSEVGDVLNWIFFFFFFLFFSWAPIIYWLLWGTLLGRYLAPWDTKKWFIHLVNDKGLIKPSQSESTKYHANIHRL